jgi:endonuclease/exonuclease/phosphatase family metal-dependent hydrolase
MTKTKSLLVAVVLFASVQVGCDKKDDEMDGGIDGGLDGPGLPVSVYTRNLYLGSEITPLATIPSPSQVPAVAATLWANIQAADFPSRAKLLADEITTLAPDLVALQEVTLYRRQVPSDWQPGDGVPNASEVVLDFLATLMTEIDARGGGYRVVGESINVDAEVPTADGAGGVFDLRLTDRDVILARDAVQTSNFVTLPFTSKFMFVSGGSGGVPISLTRSASYVDAMVGEAHFTFGNGHLEIQSLQPFQTAQAGELLAGFAPIPDPVLLLGDFNSEPGMNSYPLLTGQFRDAYTDAGGTDPGGFTCCQAADLMNPTSTAGDRIDLVLYRGRFRVNDVTVVGTDPATSRTPGGLWPSDHFGVFAHVEFVPLPAPDGGAGAP